MSVKPGKIALVTGATSGIGKCTAFQLISEGVEVIFTGRNLKGLKEEVLSSYGENSKHHFIKADLFRDNDIERLVSKVNKITTKLDILIHSAGIIGIGSVEQSNIHDLDRMYGINLRAPFSLTQKFLPLLKNAKGCIVFVNSTAGLQSWENISQYAATKHGLTAFAKSLRNEVSSEDVKVISVFPGGTDTPMQEWIQKKDRKEYDPQNFMPVQEVAICIVNAIKASEKSMTTDIVIKPLNG